MVAAAAAHPVLFRTPLLIERTDQDFIQGLYRDLKTGEGRQRLRDQAQESKSAGLRLKQPVHRAHNVFVAEIVCDRYAYPRVDPRRVDGAGLVVRRIVTDSKGRRVVPETLEGWISQDKTLRGWATFENAADLGVDPDPKHRQAPYVSGHAEINQRLLALAEKHFQITESSSPAFVVPPDVCEAAGRTFVYGVVPVTSFETAEVESAPQYSEQELLTGYSTFFKRGPERHISTTVMPTFVRQVAAEYGALGKEPEEKALFAVLNELVVMPNNVRGGHYVQYVYSQMYERAPGAAFECTWPEITEAMAAKLKAAVFAVKRKRLAKFIPHTGRFDDLKAWYRARLFVRAREHPECPCPPKLYWSDYSDPFQVVPWYEHSGPPVRIAMPDITRESVKSLKPNVAFEMPPGLFNLLANNSPDAFLKGEAKEGGVGLGITWLCSFSLPIITLCAFIVLNIMLQLLNLVFWWMLYIKICIPLPAPKKNP